MNMHLLKPEILFFFDLQRVYAFNLTLKGTLLSVVDMSFGLHFLFCSCRLHYFFFILHLDCSCFFPLSSYLYINVLRPFNWFCSCFVDLIVIYVYLSYTLLFVFVVRQVCFAKYLFTLVWIFAY